MDPGPTMTITATTSTMSIIMGIHTLMATTITMPMG